MATTYLTWTDVEYGTRFGSSANNTDLMVAASALVGSRDGVAISLTGSYNDVYVRGTVMGDVGGIRMGDSSWQDVRNNLTIETGGSVMGQTAIGLMGSDTLLNHGDINGSWFGVQVDLSGSATSTILNDGGISGFQVGLYVNNYDWSHFSLTNLGTISGTSHGMTIISTSNAKSLVVNEGIIRGDSYSFVAGDGSTRLVNHGELLGDVLLGYGNDTYDGRGGRVDGKVWADWGDDVFLPGSEAEAFEGSGGVDTLDFRGSEGLRVSLLDDSGTGRAEGDIYTGFERILGSRGGADTLIGDHGDNTLMGFGGADKLQGNGGNDALGGGGGADRLTGGAGNDHFVLAAPDQGVDLISDFSNTESNDDAFQISASGFGGGLVAGTTLAASQFRARADNLAQDANDRFVFRTTDKTLWFDLDGKGGAAAVMLADLQSSATLTSADILLV